MDMSSHKYSHAQQLNSMCILAKIIAKEGGILSNNVYSELKVLDLSDLSAAYCGKLLAAYGAHVLKIEPPGGERTRYMGPFAGRPADPEKSLLFAYTNCGKHSAVLDLTAESDRQKFLTLVSQYDVLIETSTPGTMEALGLDYPSLHAINPRLIVASVTPFGQTGPHRLWKAPTDLILDAMGGPMGNMCLPNRPPLHLGYDILGPASSLYVLIAIQAALHRRVRTGKGAYIDMSQQECLIPWKSNMLGDAQTLRKDPPVSVSRGLVRCKDGMVFLFIGGKWKALLDWMEETGIDTTVLKDEQYDCHNYDVLAPWDDVLNDKLQEFGRYYTKTELMLQGQLRKIPVGALETADTLLEYEQLRERDFFHEIDHPVLGKLTYMGPVAKMSSLEQDILSRAPLLGEDQI